MMYRKETIFKSLTLYPDNDEHGTKLVLTKDNIVDFTVDKCDYIHKIICVINLNNGCTYKFVTCDEELVSSIFCLIRGEGIFHHE